MSLLKRLCGTRFFLILFIRGGSRGVKAAFSLWAETRFRVLLLRPEGNARRRISAGRLLMGKEERETYSGSANGSPPSRFISRAIFQSMEITSAPTAKMPSPTETSQKVGV